MSSLPEAYDAVLLTGTVGAGKTTTASALSELQWAAGRVHAVVDLDQVRLLRPPPVGDPFQHEVELANLHDLARNYRAAGATRLIVAGVVEEAGEVPRSSRRWAGAGCCCAGSPATPAWWRNASAAAPRRPVGPRLAPRPGRGALLSPGRPRVRGPPDRHHRQVARGGRTRPAGRGRLVTPAGTSAARS
ncbi:MAG: hypothetical protein ACRYG2_07460 [Janthinobacterium lividum]